MRNAKNFYHWAAQFLEKKNYKLWCGTDEDDGDELFFRMIDSEKITFYFQEHNLKQKILQDKKIRDLFAFREHKLLRINQKWIFMRAELSWIFFLPWENIELRKKKEH